MTLKLCNNGLCVYGTREDGATISYSIEAEEYKQWLSEGNTPEPEFTQAELEAIAKEQAKQEALTKIASLEAAQLRSIRELMLDSSNAFAKAKLEDIEAQIQAERLKL